MSDIFKTKVKHMFNSSNTIQAQNNFDNIYKRNRKEHDINDGIEFDIKAYAEAKKKSKNANAALNSYSWYTDNNSINKLSTTSSWTNSIIYKKEEPFNMGCSSLKANEIFEWKSKNKKDKIRKINNLIDLETKATGSQGTSKNTTDKIQRSINKFKNNLVKEATKNKSSWMNRPVVNAGKIGENNYYHPITTKINILVNGTTDEAGRRSSSGERTSWRFNVNSVKTQQPKWTSLLNRMKADQVKYASINLSNDNKTISDDTEMFSMQFKGNKQFSSIVDKFNQLKTKNLNDIKRSSSTLNQRFWTDF